MKEKVCKNCVYFHPEEYEEGFGGCGVTPNWEKRRESDACCDFSFEDPLYPDRRKI